MPRTLRMLGLGSPKSCSGQKSLKSRNLPDADDSRTERADSWTDAGYNPSGFEATRVIFPNEKKAWPQQEMFDFDERMIPGDIGGLCPGGSDPIPPDLRTAVSQPRPQHSERYPQQTPTPELRRATSYRQLLHHRQHPQHTGTPGNEGARDPPEFLRAVFQPPQLIQVCAPPVIRKAKSQRQLSHAQEPLIPLQNQGFRKSYHGHDDPAKARRGNVDLFLARSRQQQLGSNHSSSWGAQSIHSAPAIGHQSKFSQRASDPNLDPRLDKSSFQSPRARKPCASTPSFSGQYPRRSVGSSFAGEKAPDSDLRPAEMMPSVEASASPNTSASKRRTRKSPQRRSVRRAPTSPSQQRNPPKVPLPPSPPPRSLLRKTNYAEYELDGLRSLGLDDQSVADEFSTTELSSLSDTTTNEICIQENLAVPTTHTGREFSVTFDPITRSGRKEEQFLSHDEKQNQRTRTRSVPVSPLGNIKSKSDHLQHSGSLSRAREMSELKSSRPLSKTWHCARSAEDKVDPTRPAEQPNGDSDDHALDSALWDDKPSRKTSCLDGPQRPVRPRRFDLDDQIEIEEICFVAPNSSSEIDWAVPCIETDPPVPIIYPPPAPKCNVEARYLHRANMDRSKGTQSLPASPSVNSRTRKSLNGRRPSRTRRPASPRKSFDLGDNRNTTREECPITASPTISNRTLGDSQAPPATPHGGIGDEHQTRRKSGSPGVTRGKRINKRGSTTKTACSEGDNPRSPRDLSSAMSSKEHVSLRKSESCSPRKRSAEKEFTCHCQVPGSTLLETTPKARDDRSTNPSDRHHSPRQRSSLLRDDEQSESVRFATGATSAMEQRLQQQDAFEIPWSNKMDLELQPLPQTNSEFESFFTAPTADPVIAGTSRTINNGNNPTKSSKKQLQEGKRGSLSVPQDSPRGLQLDKHFVEHQEAQPSDLPCFDSDDESTAATRNDDTERNDTQGKKQGIKTQCCRGNRNRGPDRSRGSGSSTCSSSRRGSLRKSKQGERCLGRCTGRSHSPRRSSHRVMARSAVVVS